MNTISKARLLQNRKWRIRKKISGTPSRPRLSIRFSSKHIYAQCVDDEAGRTLVFLSTLDPALREHKAAANRKGAEALGKAFGDRAKAAGVSEVVFDRNGRLYHGIIKTFADAVRASGIKF